MIKAATAKEMREIDRITIKRHGIASIELMERAGLACVKKINEIYFSTLSPHSGEPACRQTGQPGLTSVYVLCGGGNNGGEGLVIARLLQEEGRDVKVFLAVDPSKLKGDAKTNYLRAKKAGIEILPIKSFLTLNSKLLPTGQAGLTQNSLIIDALFGTGLSREIRPPFSDIIKKVNILSLPVFSIDIPSGISSDTGQVMGAAVRAAHTITFGLPKRGHLLYPGADFTGELSIADIGFPQKLLKSKSLKASLIERKDAVSFMPKRPRNSHKGTYGHVLITAGSRGKTGAALMTAKACLRTGAGLVTLGVPETLVDAFQRRVTEEMILPLPDKGDGTLSYDALGILMSFIKKRCDVLAIGPGISVSEDIKKLVKSLVEKLSIPVVIDADGINALSGGAALIRKSRAKLILTPHTGEMARLLSERSAEIEKDRINTAVSFSKKAKAHLALKGAPTVISSPEGEAFINSTGNPGMATAGSGDVLTGMISALLAQGLNPKNASILGVYMHGLAGDIAAGRKGERSLIASDIINAIPKAYKALSS
ncbi:MAG: NAD(P)H-hydrate dehydratase [Nitrospirae bacterium]|nr:NAD(P)H-hydrate dehydratase [Nitrospirota bacterium]